MRPGPTLICDLDNTLYDWVGYFVPSFYAMVDKAVTVLDCNRDDLLDEFRAIHQQHHNSEHPFALLETNIVRTWLAQRGGNIHLLDPVFHRFNSERKHRLITYPKVHETLSMLKERGVRLIAHSDSNVLAVIDRLARLELSSYFELVYCVDKSDRQHPHGRPRSRIYDEFPLEIVRLLRRDERKPNPKVVGHIISENGLNAIEVAYVGDSMAKDIVMAKSAGIKAIWAQYGARVDTQLYSQLVRVSHWSEDDVRRERALNDAIKGTVPDYICATGFNEVEDALLALF